jgi:hypothetical protein
MKTTYEVGHDDFKFKVTTNSPLEAAEEVLEMLSEKTIRRIGQLYVQSLKPGVECKLFDITVSDRYVFVKEGTELKSGRKI